MKPIISVIIPVYKVELYLRQCVESVLNQSFSDFELVLVDDGSPDNSGLIADEYAKKDSRVKVIHKANAGVSEARNDGLRVACGQYAFIMDSDDYLEHDSLQLMYEAACNTGADVVISDHYTFKNELKQIPHRFFSEEFFREDREFIDELQRMVLHPGYSPLYTNENTGLGIAAPWTKLVKMSIVRENDLLFDPYVKGIFDDGLFALEVFQYAQSVSYIAVPTIHYRILDTSLIHRFNPERKIIDKRVFERIREFGEMHTKGAAFKDAYYARVIIYLVHSFAIYYFNNSYNGSLLQNYKEFVSMMKDSDYSDAIRFVEIARLKRVQKGVTILARLHLYPCIWLPFQIRKWIKNWKSNAKRVHC